jgi:nucleoside-diphosphate-sugar epimerase
MLTGAAAAGTGVSTAWGRLFSVYGPHEHPKRLVPSVTQSLLAGEPALCSHGTQIRDYLFAEDAADALLTLLESDVSGPINLASGQPVALRDIITRIGALLGRPDLIRLGAIPAAPSDKPFVVADTTRTVSALGWRPRHTLESGLLQTIAWWRRQTMPAGLAGQIA